jgi:hypothetical protein
MKEQGSMGSKYKPGYRFTTGNAVVAQLEEETILAKVGKNQLEIVDVPVQTIEVGDRVNTKYGEGTVVRLSSRLSGLSLKSGQVLYIADGTDVIRVANADDLSHVD